MTTPPPLARVHAVVRYARQTGVFIRRKTGRVTGRTLKGYVLIKIEGREFFAHRLAWYMTYGSWPSSGIDHIDGDPGNNRLANLRLADTSQQAMNMKRTARNTVGLKGVTIHKKTGKYQAQLKKNGRNYYLGLHSTPEAAHAAYWEAAKVHFAAYACTGERA